MPTGTDRLASHFPDAYAARERESLLFKLLDAVGAELDAADDALRRLLKSHWVDYADGPALDGLGAIYGVERRRLPGGVLEEDDAFRLRLKSVVRLFTGGGTRRAVLGGVRSALGLPFAVEQMGIPDAYAGLRRDLEELIRLVEFSPRTERLTAAATEESPGRAALPVPMVSVAAAAPRFEWTCTRGGARRLRIERDGGAAVLAADDALVVPRGATLHLSTRPDGGLAAFLDAADVSTHFAGPGGAPPALPEVPREPSEWVFTASGALFDRSPFDAHDTFDPPLFRVEMSWQSREPLTFDVIVPYHLGGAVKALCTRHGYPGEIFVYKGLDLDVIQAVVDRTRAAGVRGRVQFYLDFRAGHDQDEALRMAGRHRRSEDAAARESLTAASGAALAEDHDAATRFGLGGVYDFSRFDAGFAFQRSGGAA